MIAHDSWMLGVSSAFNDDGVEVMGVAVAEFGVTTDDGKDLSETADGSGGRVGPATTEDGTTGAEGVIDGVEGTVSFVAGDTGFNFPSA